MTFYYKTYSWANNSNQGISEETKKTWEFFADKKIGESYNYQMDFTKLNAKL